MLIKHNTNQCKDGYLNRTPYFQFILLSCLFPLWGAAASLNDILITQFKSIFALSNFASALVQSAFYGGYFLIAIPASLVIKKTSYKATILAGLIVYTIGCTLFFPASTMATYTMFLAAIFSIAIGLSFLETSVNTYSSMIGESSKSTLRLNISQTFYPVGAVAGILLGKYLVFQDGASLEDQMALMTAEQLHVFKLEMLQHTLKPYKYLIYILIFVTCLFAITSFPKCKASTTTKQTDILETLRYLSTNQRFKKGIVTQWFYVGMQVAVWSFTIRLALELGDLNERTASNYLIYSFAAFFIGKFIANILITKYSQEKVLISYSVLGMLSLTYVSLEPNFSAVWMAIVTSLLFGPCWATIYTSTLQTVERKYTETAGAVIVMAIVGAAVIPAIQGLVADKFGLQLSFFIDLICFTVVAYYFAAEQKIKASMSSQAVVSKNELNS
ncbi:L-fucose:H+ symporter permease [Photobacterium leiognathi]|uniref:L-fucose:H+ symporter permease n=1 Tax=Photobacterium leiognathi TaxID=553611 RepID=UPI001EDCD6B6|nr:L-fucose:H+ symporter permease [Photobacterium leiognathi]MCG3884838.1 L-fucose:H+ symporter permease [Photobacterium leiognathi]